MDNIQRLGCFPCSTGNSAPANADASNLSYRTEAAQMTHETTRHAAVSCGLQPSELACGTLLCSTILPMQLKSPRSVRSM